ncbi:MAG: DNA primase, partial [Hyphomicrobiales bacterium]
DGLRGLMEKACAFFQQSLTGGAGGPARAYLDRRGLAAREIETFRIGFAPDSRHALKDYLAGQGATQEQMIAAGLLIAGDDIPVSYDRFRNRVIFPICDLQGRVVAFGGRALDASAPAKYLNSPETSLFHKGHVLFNAHRARAAAHDAGSVVAVEGYMDVIALAGVGIANVVAPLGTALTDDQLGLLWRMAEEPVLCFDGDAAGLKAAYRAIDVALPLLGAGRSLRFAFLPEGLDPDDLARREGAAGVRTVLEEARPLADVLWGRETEAGPFDTPERRAALEARLASLLKEIRDERVRRHYGQDFKQRLARLWAAASAPPPGRAGSGARPYPAGSNASPSAREGRNSGRPGGWRDRRGPPQPWVSAPPSEALRRSGLVSGAAQIAPREALLLLTLLNHPWMLEEWAEEIARVEFASRALADLRDAMLDVQAGQKDLDIAGFRTQLSRHEKGAAVARIERAITHKSDWFAEPGASRRDVETGWRQVLTLHRRSFELKRELEAAVRALGEEGTEAAFERLKAVQQQLAALDGTEASVEGYGSGPGRAA